MNILILTREMQTNNNTIYNSYTKGIVNNCKHSIVIDYFNLYFDNGKKDFESSILNTIQENSIDIVFINFVSGDLTFDLNFLSLISSQSFLMMNFYDSELFFEPIDRYYAQCADLVLLPTSSYFTYSYKVLNINAISTLSLFDTSIYKNLAIKKDIDISFIGDITKKSRQEFINYLGENGYKVATYGFGTKNGKLNFNEMVNIFNRSKINLNFSDTINHRSFVREFNMDYSSIPKIAKYIQQLKGRIIEVALCGGFTLTQNVLGIDELFNSDQIDRFDTKEELLNKVKYYLKESELRETMANNAYKSSIIKFDATKQFKIIFNNINLMKRDKKVIYTDDIFISNFYTYHTLYLFNFLFKLRFKYFFQEFKIIKLRKLRLSSVYYHFTQQFKFQIINKMSRKK
ncbi:MAG: glycosyltransferase family 1 protein [Sulfurovum sp.]|nr:glycosyltransferase family 1 protein [Sulfurovaceae bacterium]